MKNQKSLLILLLCLLFAACSKKSEIVSFQDKNDSQFYAEIASVRNEVNQKNKILQEENAEATSIADESTQESENSEESSTIENKINGTNVNEVEKLDYVIDTDDSPYDDATTTEFSLQNVYGQKCILYHNIRKIENLDYANYKEYKDWETPYKTLEYSGISFMWVYDDGTILQMTTESPEWETKRGVKVGDPIEKVTELYGPDSYIFVWDYEKEEYKKTTFDENSSFSLLVTNDFQSLNAGNKIEEEMMSMVFHQKDGIICKIEIYCHS